MNDKSEPTKSDIDNSVADGIAAPNRTMAPVRYYGGKGHLVRKIIQHIPYGKIYVEPYCGAASIFWHLEPRPVEVLNDLYGEIVNLFRTLQDPDQFDKLRHRLLWTPYSLDEFRRALAIRNSDAGDAIDRAWAFFVTQGQGFSGIAKSKGNWSRTFTSARAMANTTCKWRSRIKLLTWWHDRLTRVQLDNRDALQVIKYWDSENTVFYLDPPYVADTRVIGHAKKYDHEPDDTHHEKLVSLLLKIDGQCVLSGYAHDLYLPLKNAGWQRMDIATACHAAGRTRGSKLRGKGNATKHAARTESLWIKSRNIPYGKYIPSPSLWRKGEEG